MTNPNVLLIICHDLGRYLGCYGRQPVSTPDLDQLAGEGLRFSQHFCTAPLCSPSRGSIMTGRYPHSNGLMGLVNLGWELPESERTLPQYLKESGYHPVLCGVQHERSDAKSLGLRLQNCPVWDHFTGATSQLSRFRVSGEKATPTSVIGRESAR